MSVLLLILKILLWVLLALLALLVVLLFIPFRVYFSYRSSRVLVRAGALGFKLDVFDSEAPKKETEEKEAGKEEKPAEKKEAEARERGGLDSELLRELIKAGGAAAARILRSLHFRRVGVTLVARGWDACETGLNTGRLWTGIGGALTLFFSVWPDFEIESLVVIPDFMDEHRGEESVYFEVFALLFSFLCAGVIFGWRFLKYKIRKFFENRRNLREERVEEL